MGHSFCYCNILFLCCYFIILFLISRKESHKLGEKYKKGIPIEVIPMAYCPVQQKIEALYGGLAELRMGKMKAVCCLIYFGICELMHVIWTVSLSAWWTPCRFVEHYAEIQNMVMNTLIGDFPLRQMRYCEWHIFSFVGTSSHW